MSQNPIEEKVIVKLKRKKIDLVQEILSVWPHSLIYIDPETLFEFTPNDRYLGNAATIGNIMEQLEKKGIEPTREIYTGVARVLNVLIRSGRAEITICRDRVFRGIPVLAIKLLDKE